MEAVFENEFCNLQIYRSFFMLSNRLNKNQQRPYNNKNNLLTLYGFPFAYIEELARTHRSCERVLRKLMWL